MADPAGDFRALGNPPKPTLRNNSGRQLATNKTGSWSEANRGPSGNSEDCMEDTEGPVMEEYNQARVTQMLNRSGTKGTLANLPAPNLLREMSRGGGGGGGGGEGSGFSFKPQPEIFGGDNGPLAEQLVEFKTSVETNVRSGLTELEQRYERILEGMAECLTEELMGVQEQLSLLQEQVDTHKSMLQKAIPEIQQKLNEEKTSRSFVQRSLRESKTQLAEHISHNNKTISDMRMRLELLESRANRGCGQILAEYLCCCFRRRQHYVAPSDWEMD